MSKLDQPLLSTLRHSTAHVLAQAVQSLYPEVKLGIGPAIDEGFYYDFDLPQTLSDDDLIRIEKEMTRIVNESQAFTYYQLNKKEALELLTSQHQSYKCELINDLNLDEYSFYENGPFVDLCKGPHIANTKSIGAFKLLKVSGAYWRGSEKNKMLQRIYGTAFFSQKELRIYLKRLEEAKKRDHRLLGRALDLFSIQDDIGGGLILWHPQGSIMRNVIETIWKQQHSEQGYQLVYTPHVGKSGLWETSGHLDFYKENMYDEMDVENQRFYMRPMNCPFHILIYKSKQHSYRQLPVRYAELGTVYRYERSGVLHGLMRVRGFTQDDAHIICTQDQAHSEIKNALQFSLDMLSLFGFKQVDLYVSTKPKEKSVGTDDKWRIAEDALKSAVTDLGLNFQIDEGGGAFYGPKIDIKIEDAIGRKWQCSTIQFDFNLPERFDMTFVNSDGQKEEPFMIHRALLGSLERFFGILIEHYEGWFPLWLAPTQCIVLTVNEAVSDYAEHVKSDLLAKGMRVESDLSSEKIGYKIRQSIQKKVPYLIILGQQEKENQTITVRHKKETIGTFDIATFMDKIKPELNPTGLTTKIM